MWPTWATPRPWRNEARSDQRCRARVVVGQLTQLRLAPEIGATVAYMGQMQCVANDHSQRQRTAGVAQGIDLRCGRTHGKVGGLNGCTQ